MKIIVFITDEIKAVLTNGHKPLLTNYYDNISEIYDFAKWACENYNTEISIEFRK